MWLWRLFPSEAWDLSACAVAREPVKAPEQDEGGGGCGCNKGRRGWSESVCGRKELLLLQHASTWYSTVEIYRPPCSLHSLQGNKRWGGRRFHFKVRLIKTPSWNSVWHAEYLGWCLLLMHGEAPAGDGKTTLPSAGGLLDWTASPSWSQERFWQWWMQWPCSHLWRNAQSSALSSEALSAQSHQLISAKSAAVLGALHSLFFS